MFIEKIKQNVGSIGASFFPGKGFCFVILPKSFAGVRIAQYLSRKHRGGIE